MSQKLTFLFLVLQQRSYLISFVHWLKGRTHYFTQQTHCSELIIIEFGSLDHPVNLTLFVKSSGAILSKTIGNEPWIEHRLTFKKYFFFSEKVTRNVCHAGCIIDQKQVTNQNWLVPKYWKYSRFMEHSNSKIFVIIPASILLWMFNVLVLRCLRYIHQFFDFVQLEYEILHWEMIQ